MNCTHWTESIRRLLDRLLDWQDRAHERRALGRLDDRMLADLGLDRATAKQQSERPFWRD